MNQEFRGYKKEIRSFMQQHYTDARLAELLAHAQEGKLDFHSCCCFVGITTANHALQSKTKSLDVAGHLKIARRLAGASDAEKAYANLSVLKLVVDHSVRANTIRRRILVPMIKAEMRRRERARCPETVQQPSLVPVEVA